MITESFFTLLFNCIRGLLALIPDISWEVNPEVFDSFFSFIHMAGYLLPMQTVIVILGIIFSFNLFKIIIAIIKTIWSVLPFT